MLRLRCFVVFFLLLCAASAVPAAEAVAGTARLQAPPEAAKPIKAIASLPVRATPVGPGQPVSKGELLLEMDLEKLERELAERRKELLSIQEEKRYRASNKQVTRGGGSSNTAQGPNNSIEMELVQKEANATRDLLEVQTRISTASPHAPEDGFLVKRLYDVGAETKKRKPLLTFVRAERTVLSVTIPADSVALFPPGTRVTIASPSAPEKRFLGSVEKPAKGAPSGSLTIRPLELPFFGLDQDVPVMLSAAP